MPYAVNVEHLRTPHAFTADPAKFLAWLEDLYCTGDELAPTPQSMRRLFYAEDLSDVDGDLGPVYGYTLEALCMRFGAPLPPIDDFPGIGHVPRCPSTPRSCAPRTCRPSTTRRWSPRSGR